MLRTSCHCGAIQVEVARRPRSLTECNCSICRRYGARWAYYPTKAVRVSAAKGAVARYSYGKRLYFDHCRKCGCVAMWVPIKSRGDADRVGVNMRLVENPDEFVNIKLHRFDGATTWRTLKSHTLVEPRW